MRFRGDERGYEAIGDLMPHHKVEYVRKLVAQYTHVGMIGDGVNDAPALAIASVGFAMGAIGSDTAIETADIAMMKEQPATAETPTGKVKLDFENNGDTSVSKTPLSEGEPMSSESLPRVAQTALIKRKKCGLFKGSCVVRSGHGRYLSKHGRVTGAELQLITLIVMNPF